jgi:rare lipoprotein A
MPRPLALTCFGLCLVLSGCAARLTAASRPGDVEEGLASWYGRGHHGHRTASGERFNMHAHTAAHRRLRFGSLVEVEDPRSQRRVVVRINDRGPFTYGRIIDLSHAAAQVLGMLRAGVIPVRVRLLRQGSAP